MTYGQGAVVLVSFPFTEFTSSKRRPALVLSLDSFNAAGEDLVLAAVTTNPAHILIYSPSRITVAPNAVRLFARRLRGRWASQAMTDESPPVIAPFLLLKVGSAHRGQPL